MKKRVKVSIVIVSFKKNLELFACLKSIYQYPLNYSFEVNVVDNAQDKKLENNLNRKFPKVQYIKSPINGGYGAGNNLGVKNSQGEYILILNPDTKFIDKSMNNLVVFLDTHKKATIVGPNLIHSNGVVFSQLGSRILTPLRAIFSLSIINKLLPNNPIAKNYWMYDTRLDILRRVDVVPGSGLLVRRKDFKAIGGFDENFFMYFEESDLCKRLSGEKYINPEAQIIHYWSPGDPGTLASEKIFRKSRFYYFKKHYGIIWAIIVDFVTRLGRRFFV